MKTRSGGHDAKLRSFAAFGLRLGFVVMLTGPSAAGQDGGGGSTLGARYPLTHAVKGCPLCRLVSFTAAPFPFDDGVMPDGKPFFETEADGVKFHASPRGGNYRADTTYADNRSLLYISPTFDPKKPNAALILFFHGNLATLEDVAGRQGVPRQLRESHLNAVLVAPQLAVKALDSSPGHFYDPHFFDAYLDEAATHLAEDTRFSKDNFTRLPVIVVAYSGGYLATAFSLHYERGESRVKGVVLLDALFGEADKFEDWVGRMKGRAFFFSAYSEASRSQNVTFERALMASTFRVQNKLPTVLTSDDIVIQGARDAVHNDFVTQAWTKDPLRDVLRRIRFDFKPVGDGRSLPDPRP